MGENKIGHETIKLGKRRLTRYLLRKLAVRKFGSRRMESSSNYRTPEQERV